MAFKLKDIVRGTTRKIDVTFLQSDGTAYDLTDGTVRLVATTESAPTDDTAAAIDASTTSHTAPTLGQTSITLAATDTDIVAGTYNVGIQATLADNTVVEKTGTVIITQDYAKTSP